MSTWGGAAIDAGHDVAASRTSTATENLLEGVNYIMRTGPGDADVRRHVSLCLTIRSTRSCQFLRTAEAENELQRIGDGSRPNFAARYM
jgi:hypothetical protein